ncbi:uncharacterized protein LOC144937600 [Lampetra fluviatilis]
MGYSMAEQQQHHQHQQQQGEAQASGLHSNEPLGRIKALSKRRHSENQHVLGTGGRVPPSEGPGEAPHAVASSDSAQRAEANVVHGEGGPRDTRQMNAAMRGLSVQETERRDASDDDDDAVADAAAGADAGADGAAGALAGGGDDGGGEEVCSQARGEDVERVDMEDALRKCIGEYKRIRIPNKFSEKRRQWQANLLSKYEL